MAWELGINRNEPVGNLADTLFAVVEPSEMLSKDLEETETNALNTTIQTTSNLTIGHLVMTGQANHLTLLGDAPLLSLTGLLDGYGE
jgi:hypothetical protein